MGVVLTGLALGVEGNIWAGYGATLLWAVIAEGEIFLDNWGVLGMPFLPAVIATIA
jgi:hypothetical protein